MLRHSLHSSTRNLTAPLPLISAKIRSKPNLILNVTNTNSYNYLNSTTNCRYNSTSAATAPAAATSDPSSNVFGTTTTTGPNTTDSTPSPGPSHQAKREGEFTVMTSPNLETLKVTGKKMERRDINKIASILRARMENRLPTLLEFQGPGASLNAVKAMIFSNQMLKGRKKVEDISFNEFVALEKYFENKTKTDKTETGPGAGPLKIGTDFEYHSKFCGNNPGYDILEDLVINVDTTLNTPTTSMEDGSNDGQVYHNQDPNRIQFAITGDERVRLVREKLKQVVQDGPEGLMMKNVMMGQEKPLVLGFIPSQFRVNEDGGYRFVMRLEPVIIAETKDIDLKKSENVKLIFPPRDRDMLFNSAQVVKNMWTDHLENNGPDLLCSAAGAESVSRVIKMLECANTIIEKNGGTQFCVRPQMIKEEDNTTGEGGEEQNLRFHYSFDFYAL